MNDSRDIAVRDGWVDAAPAGFEVALSVSRLRHGVIIEVIAQDTRPAPGAIGHSLTPGRIINRAHIGPGALFARVTGARDEDRAILAVSAWK
jgi:hypothetical protein